jgi:hypothetical protein
MPRTLKPIDYDEAMEVIRGWIGREALVLTLAPAPSEPEIRAFQGVLRFTPAPQPGQPVITGRSNRRAEANAGEGLLLDVIEGSAGSTTGGRLRLRFGLFRTTFSAAAWSEHPNAGRGLVLRHRAVSWSIYPRPNDDAEGASG